MPSELEPYNTATSRSHQARLETIPQERPIQVAHSTQHTGHSTKEQHAPFRAAAFSIELVIMAVPQHAAALR